MRPVRNELGLTVERYLYRLKDGLNIHFALALRAEALVVWVSSYNVTVAVVLYIGWRPSLLNGKGRA